MVSERSTTLKAWALVTYLLRANPGLLVTETRSAPGHPTCLTLIRGGEHLIDIDEAGTVTVPGSPAFGTVPVSDFFERVDSAAFREALEESVGLRGISSPSPEGSARPLTFQVLTAVLSSTRAGDQVWEAHNEVLDTSGREPYVRGYLECFPTAAEHGPRIPGLTHPRQRFWALLRDGAPVALLDIDGHIHVAGEVLHLPTLHEESGFRLTRTVAVALGPVVDSF
ncbi:hypothetical protein [Actinoplanes sp. NPDC051851]|uniref:TY-Chap2 family putative peptide chaperone n=1 Tax=Actinoplanes sp. NPDC051851 TaxID=3154753 RepID=UPI00343451AD